MSNSSGIKVDSVTVTYKNGVTALKDASFEIPTGTIAALVGVNGSGKSTLFKAIMGFVPLATGSVEILGQPARKMLGKVKVAYVPQLLATEIPYSVREFITMGRYVFDGKSEEVVERVMELVKITDFAEREVSTLSGGEAQRVKLASYLGKSANFSNHLFIFDEPTTGLHFYDVQKLLIAMEKLVLNGHTVLVIEHNLDVIRNSDYVIDLGPEGGDGGGSLIFQGPISGLKFNKQSYTAKFL